MEIKEGTLKLNNGENLSVPEAEQIAQSLTESQIPAEDKKTFLKSLHKCGESRTEIEGFSNVFQEASLNPELEDIASDSIDVCGTGGDHSGSYNISTTVAMILASAEVPVIKHGNRSITSKCGSAQFLEALGLKINLDLEIHKKAMEKLNFTFLFAPSFHPAFKEIMPVRQELASEGQSTIFNILGPLINPAKPAHQLLGVYSRKLLTEMASSLHNKGLKAGFTANCQTSKGEPDIDEVSCAGINHIVGFGRLSKDSCQFEAAKFKLSNCKIEDLRGGEIAENLTLLEKIKNNTVQKGLKETIFLNAGIAFYIVNKTNSIQEGIQLASDTVLSGQLNRWIETAKNFYQEI